MTYRIQNIFNKTRLITLVIVIAAIVGAVALSASTAHAQYVTAAQILSPEWGDTVPATSNFQMEGHATYDFASNHDFLSCGMYNYTDDEWIMGPIQVPIGDDEDDRRTDCGPWWGTYTFPSGGQKEIAALAEKDLDPVPGIGTAGHSIVITAEEPVDVDLEATAECSGGTVQTELFWDVSSTGIDYFQCQVVRTNNDEVVATGYPNSFPGMGDSNPPQNTHVSYLLECRTTLQYMFGQSFESVASASVNTDISQCKVLGNRSPVAVDDGADAPIPVDDDGSTSINALYNDYDPDDGPDPLSIQNANTNSSQSSVSIVNDELVYSPNGLSPGTEDHIYYTITDGEDTDDGLVYVRLAGGTGTIKLNTDIMGTVSFSASYIDQSGSTSLGLGLNEGSQMTMTYGLYQEPGLFSIPYDSVVYYEDELPDENDDWIAKDVMYDKTGNKWSAELGLSYTENEGGGGGEGGGNQPPVADFIFSMESPDNPECADGVDVEFNDNSTDPDGDLLTYAWEFGDGNTSTQKNPTHTYPGYDPIGGSWDVTLTVSDGEYSDSVTHSHNATCNI